VPGACSCDARLCPDPTGRGGDPLKAIWAARGLAPCPPRPRGRGLCWPDRPRFNGVRRACRVPDPRRRPSPSPPGELGSVGGWLRPAPRGRPLPSSNHARTPRVKEVTP